MDKTSLPKIILRLIFPIIFNAIFFVVGGIEHHVSVWISYGFVHWAYALLLLTPSLVHRGKSAAVFGFALYTLSYIYFFAELFVGVVFILIATDGFRVAFWVQLIMAGIHGVMLVAHIIANEKTADAEERRQVQIDFIKDATIQLKLVLDRIQDKSALRKAERAYDALRSSAVKSCPELTQMENRILVLIDTIGQAASAGNNDTIIRLADSLLNAVNERNMRLRQYLS